MARSTTTSRWRPTCATCAGSTGCSAATDLSRRALAALVDGGPAPLTLLDVGTGAADIPAALLADARRTGTSVRITAIDSRHEMLAAAVATDPSLANLPGLHLRVGDGLALTDADGSFDVVHASMVLHHLEPPEAVSSCARWRASRGRGSSSTTSSGAGWHGSGPG